jgi:hypothetical protein
VDLIGSLFRLAILIFLVKLGWELINWIVGVIQFMSLLCCLGVFAVLGAGLYLLYNRIRDDY